ncbi:MAG: hypothetical protein GY865_04150 [candidate division Zixibacteria bacterium]|nr:hypothetical protein [candidate division Zixibacteria bacterium]
MRKLNSFSMLLMLLLMIFISSASADIPQLISFQGVLADDLGKALDTTLPVTFTIYYEETGGLSLWSETHPSVTVRGGLFDILLGSIEPLVDTVFADTSRWLGITAGIEDEMSPRTSFSSVPYSYRVGTIDSASGGTINGDLAVTGKVTIGSYNVNDGNESFVVGSHNTSGHDYVAICGGRYNEGFGMYSNVPGGFSNHAMGDYVAIGGGMGNSADGMFAFIPGGTRNIADGDYSFVLGSMGIAGHIGSIVISANNCGT